jgi:hypothetical protein
MRGVKLPSGLVSLRIIVHLPALVYGRIVFSTVMRFALQHAFALALLVNELVLFISTP